MNNKHQYKVRIKGSGRWWTKKPFACGRGGVEAWLNQAFIAGVEFEIFSKSNRYLRSHTTVWTEAEAMPAYIKKALS
jgi:hypothetical protein